MTLYVVDVHRTHTSLVPTLVPIIGWDERVPRGLIDYSPGLFADLHNPVHDPLFDVVQCTDRSFPGVPEFMQWAEHHLNEVEAQRASQGAVATGTGPDKGQYHSRGDLHKRVAPVKTIKRLDIPWLIMKGLQPGNTFTADGARARAVAAGAESGSANGPVTNLRRNGYTVLIKPGVYRVLKVFPQGTKLKRLARDGSEHPRSIPTLEEMKEVRRRCVQKWGSVYADTQVERFAPRLDVVARHDYVMLKKDLTTPPG